MTVSASAVARSVVANDSVECFGITTDRPRNDRLVRRLGEEKHLVDPRSLPLCGPRFCVMAKCARSLDRRMTAQSFRNRVVAPTWLTFDILDTTGAPMMLSLCGNLGTFGYVLNEIGCNPAKHSVSSVCESSVDSLS